MSYLENMASQYGLNCWQEGIVPVRDEKGIWTDGIYVVFRYYYKGGIGQEAIRKLIENLQDSLRIMAEAGIE
jgi:RimJ/RimL family protein N-acetyltransferase